MPKDRFRYNSQNQMGYSLKRIQNLINGFSTVLKKIHIALVNIDT